MEIQPTQTFKKFLQAKTLNAKRNKSYLSMMQFKATESIPQEGNDETTNLRKHACKAKWDGQQSRYIVSKNYHQHGRVKKNHHEKSTTK